MNILVCSISFLKEIIFVYLLSIFGLTIHELFEQIAPLISLLEDYTAFLKLLFITFFFQGYLQFPDKTCKVCHILSEKHIFAFIQLKVYKSCF